MERHEIDVILERTERALDTERRPDLRALGFWRAVTAAKREPDVRARHAARIAALDRRAFLARTPLAVPIQLGVALLTLGAMAGAALLVVAFALPPDLAGLAILASTGALIGATHDLAHVVAGAAAGIRFTHFYTAGPQRPQPGVKIEYESYLRASPRGRAWMHAAGAIVTKIIPFLLIPLALAARAPGWTVALLLLIGVAQIVTDVLFSTKSGDWKRFRRELRFARAR